MELQGVEAEAFSRRPRGPGTMALRARSALSHHTAAATVSGPPSSPSTLRKRP